MFCDLRFAFPETILFKARLTKFCLKIIPKKADVSFASIILVMKL